MRENILIAIILILLGFVLYLFINNKQKDSVSNAIKVLAEEQKKRPGTNQ